MNRVLSRIFIPILAYVQRVGQEAEPRAETVHSQLEVLIAEAREEALLSEIALEDFQEALFPVIAWTDEQLANLPAWRTNRDWRPFLLQRKLYKTTLAGVTFYERLDALPEDKQDLREIYVLCLCMRFLGRYAQNPNDPELVALRLKNYKLVRPNGNFLNDGRLEPLFPDAYRIAEEHNSKGKRSVSSKRLWLLAIIVPLLGLIALAMLFNYDLTIKVNAITKVLNP